MLSNQTAQQVENRRLRARRMRWIDSGPLRKWRLHRSFSLQDAAIYLRVSHATYQKWETGLAMPRELIKVRTEHDPLAWETVKWNDHMKPLCGVDYAAVVHFFSKMPRMS